MKFTEDEIKAGNMLWKKSMNGDLIKLKKLHKELKKLSIKIENNSDCHETKQLLKDYVDKE